MLLRVDADAGRGAFRPHIIAIHFSTTLALSIFAKVLFWIGVRVINKSIVLLRALVLGDRARRSRMWLYRSRGGFCAGCLLGHGIASIDPVGVDINGLSEI